MAGKAHGNGDRRGDNTICGLGDRLRRLTAGICLITQTIFPVMAAAPTHINHARSDTATSLILPNVKTIPYTLGVLESPSTVAARFGITVDELRRLNQFRTFARGFDNVRQGDEIDVPLINSNSPEARNLKAMQMERDGKDPQMQVAEMAQQSGTLLARDMDSEQAASMARGWVASSASAQATDWLSRWGTARVSLGVDEDFSLKSSSFEFLHPWYETPDNLVFSQHTLHRTDDRTQTNHGIGWRYFTPSWMSGVNMFIDHDLTRYHTRTGMGVEYWRDYLKLSGNGYLRLSNWRSAPELDHDYEARPANGWDLRAEGWLPAWPQLGGKLVYEQYYGDEVALFGKDERQNDPHAITAGLSYTPVPLISFSAEQRQGKQGENDTRIGMELTLQPGHSLQKQLDPAEVAARRSLVGSRYDLVDRNNNIVLEYRKKELVRLTLTDPLKGKPGEVKSLVSSLQTKYALKGYDIEAASLQSAGGKVAVSGKDIQVTIPPYRFTAMPETDNTYPIAVTAEDSKGNFSRREESMVVVEKPTLSLADSTLSVDLQILLADGKSTSTLTYTARDSSGKPIPGMTLKTQAKGLQDFALSEWKDNGNGTYTQIVTAGKTSGALSLMPQFNGDDIAKTPALIAIVANTASRADSTIETDQDNYVAGKPIVVKVTLRDDNGNGVTGRKELLKQTVKVDNTKADAVSAWTEESEGIYKASYTAHLIGDKLTAQLTMPGWQTKHSDAFSIAGDKDTAKIAAMQITANNAVARRDHNTVAVTVRDVHQNLLQGQNVTFTVVNGAAVFADPNGGIVTTDKDGIASVNLVSDQAVNSLIKAEINGSTDANGNVLAGQTVSMMAGNGATVAPTVITEPDGTVEIPVTSQTAGASAVTASINSSNASRNVTFVADVRTAKIADLVVIKDGSVADGAMANTLQVKVTDAFGNALGGQTVSVTAGNSATVTPTVTTQSDGTVEFSVTSQTAGVSAVTATINNHSLSQNVTFVPGDASQLTSTVETNKSNYTVGETITITVTLRDAFDNLVTGAASQLAANSVLTVDGTDPSETGSWVESGGVYTTTRMATIAGTDQHANLQLQTWSDGVTSDRYDIQSGSPAQATSTIATDKNAYIAGETITVAVTLKDAHGNLVEGGESLLSGDNVTVEGAVRSGGWSETAGVYTATWSAQMAGDSHHATLTLPEWGGSKQSESYSIHSGAPVQANSAIRTDKSAYIAGEPLTVTVTLRDEFGNPALGLTSEVIESYIDNFAVGGATPDSLYWVEQNSGEYTIVWTAWVAEENLVASLKLKTWAMEIKSSLYGIQPGAAAQTQSTIVTDKTKYIAGDSITVTVVLKDAQGNFITDGVAQLNEENVQVRNADSIQGNNWVYNGDGKYQRQYMAHFAEANLNAQLKMAGWSDANYSKNYTINRGEVSMFRSQLRIHEVLVVAGADIPVSVLLADEFGNPVNDGLDLLTDDAVYLQNVEKKEGTKWVSVGEGRYERTYRAYKEGENLNSYLHINGWYVNGQPSYTILPFVEVESLSVNGVRFRATDGFPETGFDGAKFTLLLTHNMRNTDYNWTAGIYGINVDSNGEVTLSLLIRSEVTITGKPKNGKGNDVVFKFKIKKWFTSLGAASSNTWDIINASCSYGQMPSSLELAQRPSGGVVPRKVGTLWGEYGNLKTYGNAFSGTDYWTTTQLLGVHEKFNPETGISELGTGKSSGLCVEYY
ncbi:inverse autotransporter beta domain-containing protein [Escherichia coli]|nr:inverse autotransporter beta domain-containing protein [Escherichia coli]